MKQITLEIGNSSWWKNIKYRKEASKILRGFRKKNLSIKFLRKYKNNSINTVIYADYILESRKK